MGVLSIFDINTGYLYYLQSAYIQVSALLNKYGEPGLKPVIGKRIDKKEGDNVTKLGAWTDQRHRNIR